MKILVVSQYFWPESFRINDLVSALVEKGHCVSVLTGIPNYPDGKFFSGYNVVKNLRQSYRGAKIMRVPLVPRGKGKKIRLLLNYFSFVFFASLFGIFSLRGKYDLIFVFANSPITVALPAIVFKKIKSAPVFLWVQDLWPESLSATKAVKNQFLLKLVEKMVHFIYRECELILVQSKAFIPSISNFGVAMNRIFYFPNSAEEFYHPVVVEEDAAERKQIPKGFIVMFAGNIGVAQDFETIISAAQKLKTHKNIYWIIIGDGRMRSWVDKEILARNLRQNFLLIGRYHPEQMPRYFALADVLLVTLRNEEIFKLTIPSKVQSYLACAKPIIASLAGEGAKVIEESHAGFSCPPENSSALAESVLKMYHMDERERKEMGLDGRKYFEKNFCRSKLIKQLDELIKGIKEVRG
ncbi:MAG: glycosyltransferase family 4 protein [Candidatus Omnitrophota bacterium]|jgi:glycosyltransferase involved in cell wall biosynthesis